MAKKRRAAAKSPDNDEPLKTFAEKRTTRASTREKRARDEDVEHVQPPEAVPSGVIERGHIIFYFRPRTNLEAAAGPADVQRFYMALCPFDAGAAEAYGDKEHPEAVLHKKNRLVMVGKKRLPSTVEHEKFWALVEATEDSLADLEKMLAPYSRQTATRGETVTGGARLLGAGVYLIVKHKYGTNLAYLLETPSKTTSVHAAFGMEMSGSYVLQVRNPEAEPTGAAAESGYSHHARVQYPPALQAIFRERRFAPANPPVLLDFRGTELLLVGARPDAVEHLANDGGEELVHFVESDRAHGTTLTPERVLELMEASKREHPIDAVVSGSWR